jgi:hypothetical protein
MCFFISAGVCQDIKPAPADKAVVYIVRPSSVGFAISFTYFDGTKFIGKFNGPRYIRYECDPGYHLFWARSENRDYIEADVDAGRIYFIEAIPRMGAIKAALQLIPLDLKNKKEMSKVMDLLEKKPSETFPASELEAETQNLQDVITKGMMKYKEEKDKGDVFEKLDRNMYYEVQSAVPGK